MSIEELKSLKEEIMENVKDLESINDCAGEEKLVLELIEFYEEEQKRRQSVTDEDLQRAIEWVNSGTWNQDIRTTNNLNTILCALRQMQGWIPVSERLPKNGEECLFVTITDEEFPTISGTYKGYFHGQIFVIENEKHGMLLAFYSQDVTHWMPMPEPPKEEV